jgi:hypothetical protein
LIKECRRGFPQRHLTTTYLTGGKPVNSGEKIISDDYIIFISSLKEELERETGIKIKNEYQTQSRVADEAKVMTEEGWSIYFSSSFPLKESLETLKTFLDKEKSLERDKIEYIDLRAQNKVYYKIRTETQEASDDEEKPQNNGENEKGDKKKD